MIKKFFNKRSAERSKSSPEIKHINDPVLGSITIQTGSRPPESDYIEGEKTETLNIFGKTNTVDIVFRTYQVNGALENAKQNYQKFKSVINNPQLGKQFKLELNENIDIKMESYLNDSQLSQLRKTKVLPKEMGWNGRSDTKRIDGGYHNRDTDNFYDMYIITHVKLGTSPQCNYDFALHGEYEADIEHGFHVAFKNGKVVGSGTASGLY